MLTFDRKDLLGKAKQMKEKGFDYLSKITAVDYTDHLEVVYLLMNIDEKREEIIKVKLDPKDPWVPTVISVFKSADWYERELSEMFGIEVRGRNTPRLLLEKWDGVDPPLRKAFKWGQAYKSAD